MSHARLLLLSALLAAGPLAAQDFPVDPPAGAGPAAGTTPPETLASPQEFLSPMAELVTPLAILDRLVVPGTRMQLEWRPGGGISANEIPSPVVVTRGAKPGPVLCLVAGVHGDEINGVEIVRRLAHGIDPTRLSGTVIGVPIVNVHGYSRGTRYLPDRRDLNRFFPGTRNGSIASRIANAFFQDIVSHCDMLVDFHTGSFDRSNLPQVRADLTNPDVLEFTRGFGATVVLHSPGNRGMLRVAATKVGIPAVTFEAGAPTRLEPAEIAQAVAAIDRLMLKLGMRQAEPDVVEINAVPLAAQLATMHVSEAGAHEAIFANTRGELCEGTGTNIAVVVDGRRTARPGGPRVLRGRDPPDVVHVDAGIDYRLRAMEHIESYLTPWSAEAEAKLAAAAATWCRR